MSDVITMTAEQLRARDMQVAEATESKLIAGGYIALTKAQIADVVARVGGPQVQAAPVAIFETYIQPAHLDAWTDQQPERTHWCVKLLAPVADIPNGSHLYIAQALAVSDDSVRSAAAPTPTSPNDQANQADLELALFAENQKRLETEQLRDQLVAALEDAVRLLRAAGYAMSGTATTPMLATIAAAKSAQHGALIDEGTKQLTITQPVAQGGTRP